MARRFGGGAGAGDRIPDWFWKAVETESRTGTVDVDDCDVAYRTWGDPDSGLPGLLLVHGMNAHSRWWDFIAPHLIDRYRVAALDLTGMGDSDYRYEYSGDTYADELVAVCDAVGFDADVRLVGHSFGGLVSVRAVHRYPDRFACLVLVDSGIRAPDDPPPDRPPVGGRAKIYPDRQTAEGRFRLQPPQPCENEWILEYIARHSLMPMDGGYTWKFDEDLPESLRGVQRTPEDYQGLSVPWGLIFGERSESFTPRMLAYLRELCGDGFPAVSIADAYHHVFLDRPLEFVDALGGMLDQLAPR